MHSFMPRTARHSRRPEESCFFPFPYQVRLHRTPVQAKDARGGQSVRGRRLTLRALLGGA